MSKAIKRGAFAALHTSAGALHKLTGTLKVYRSKKEQAEFWNGCKGQ